MAIADMIGILAAVLSSALGGLSIGTTRLIIGATDPLTLGAFRFGIGCLLLWPLALTRKRSTFTPQELVRVAALGLLYFAGFPILFNASLIFTSAARGALALSTLPLVTMIVAALLGVEPLTRRKSVGVALAMLGVGLALATGLAHAPPDAWRGDLIMVLAAVSMAFYSIWSRPLIKRHGSIPFTARAMTVGAIALVAASAWRGGFDAAAAFGPVEWSVVAFLGVLGSAVTFYLWSLALAKTTPTLVALSVTVNPIMAALFGASVLGEPITWNLVGGLVMVVVGILIAALDRKPATEAAPQ